jgi:hypothetical protein
VETKLEIIWDGDVPGLSDRRLSLDAFGPALRRLLMAVRRIANDKEMRARGPERERSKGRLAKDASQLDIQIVTIRANSPVMLSAVVVPLETPVRPLITDLPEVAIDEFLADIDREARGAPTHFQVRKFLRSLPKGLSRQTYVHRAEDGSVRKEINLSAVAITEPRRSSYLLAVEGELVGLGFEPGHTEIKIRAVTGDLVTLAATSAQVEQALDLRLSGIHALAVVDINGKTRLLRVGRQVPSERDPRDRTQQLFQTWNGLLERLSQ